VSRPHLRVLAIGPAARSGDRYEMQPVQIYSGVLSPDVLLDALDAAGAQWPEWHVAHRSGRS